MMHENKRVEIVLQILRRRILKIDNLIRSYSCVRGRNLFHHSISTVNDILYFDYFHFESVQLVMQSLLLNIA